MTSDDTWMTSVTSKSPLKILAQNGELVTIIILYFFLAMVNIPTKFQVHTNIYTNMTSNDPWMTLDDLENTIKKFDLNYTHLSAIFHNKKQWL